MQADPMSELKVMLHRLQASPLQGTVETYMSSIAQLISTNQSWHSDLKDPALHVHAYARTHALAGLLQSLSLLKQMMRA